MFPRPPMFQEYLACNNSIDQIYKAMENDDLSEVVVTALDILKKTTELPPYPKFCKNDVKSTHIRNLGNNAYKVGSYQKALTLYNQALLMAPINSRVMVLAFSNRSALLHKVKRYKESLIDIEYCLSLGCPSDILEKLKNRKEDISKSINEVDENFLQNYFSTVTDKYFKCDAPTRPKISCIGSHVEITKDGMPKIVAAKNIKVGTVLACEKAFVSFTDEPQCHLACYFCQKVSLNLVPCDGCCFALFCNKECKEKCLAEFHKYECLIKEVLVAICLGPVPNLMVKACLKIKSMCKSWDELIDISQRYGIKNMLSSTVKDNFDNTSKCSILMHRDDKPFVYGAIFNASFACAAILHYLEQLTPLFDDSFDKKEMHLRALGRIMMFVSVYQTPMHIVQAVSNATTGQISVTNILNYGLFTFTAKLKRNCNPNVIVSNRNNSVVLIAVKPIARGEEITISFQPQLDMGDHDERFKNAKSFIYCGTVCGCHNCSGKATAKGDQSRNLTKYQKSYFLNMNLREIEHNLNALNITTYYEKLVEALEVLHNVPYSKEYSIIWKLFFKCIICFETMVNKNIMLDDIRVLDLL